MPRSLILACANFVSAAISRIPIPILVTHLGEADWVELVLARQLKASRLAGLHVVRSLGGHLDSGVDLLVVVGGNDRQVLHADDARGEQWALVANTHAVFCDSGLLHVVASLTTDDKALMAGSHIHNGINAAASATGEESARVDSRVHEVKVDLLAERVWLAWVPQVLELGLDAWRDGVPELNLCVEQ